MTDERRPRDEAAMADILASIRRIVSEEDLRGGGAAAPAGSLDDVLELTPAMRVDGGGPTTATAAPSPSEAFAAVARPMGAAPAAERPVAPDPAAPPGGQSRQAGAPPPPRAATVESGVDDLGPLSVDEAQIADIAREVLRDELKGELGKTFTRNIRKLVRDEIAAAFAERDREAGR